jgi:hypothetical protein
MAALMQFEVGNGLSRELPILLRIEAKAGRGRAGKPVAKQIEEGTDIYSLVLLFWQPGMVNRLYNDLRSLTGSCAHVIKASFAKPCSGIVSPPAPEQGFDEYPTRPSSASCSSLAVEACSEHRQCAPRRSEPERPASGVRGKRGPNKLFL